MIVEKEFQKENSCTALELGSANICRKAYKSEE